MKPKCQKDENCELEWILGGSKNINEKLVILSLEIQRLSSIKRLSGFTKTTFELVCDNYCNILALSGAQGVTISACIFSLSD